MTNRDEQTKARTDALASANLFRISAELEEAQSDVALLERLKSAVDREKRLTTEKDKAIAARTKALAAEAKAKAVSRFAGITDVRVTCTTNNENLLRSGFSIEYTKPRWNGFESLPAPRVADHFGALPPEVLDYIIEIRPDVIPAAIMALAPDNPREAFGRYNLAKRRGYVAA